MFNFLTQVIRRRLRFFVLSALVNRKPALLILLDPAHFIMLVAIGALPLIFVYLLVVTLEAYLIFTIAGIKVLLLFLQPRLAHIANVLPLSHDLELLFFNKLALFVQSELLSIEALFIIFTFDQVFVLFGGICRVMIINWLLVAIIIFILLVCLLVVRV